MKNINEGIASIEITYQKENKTNDKQITTFQH